MNSIESWIAVGTCIGTAAALLAWIGLNIVALVRRTWDAECALAIGYLLAIGVIGGGGSAGLAFLIWQILHLPFAAA